LDEAIAMSEPTRIVSLLPSATELVYALGLGERLVGVTHECDFPPAALHKPRLTSSALPHAGDAGTIDRHVRASLHEGSSLYALDQDALDGLRPDLIITQELCDVCAVSYGIVARAARELTRSGDAPARVISLEPLSLEDVYANIATVAEAAGEPQRAAAVIARLRARAGALARAVAGRARPRTLVIEWTDPPFSGGHWTPGLVELAGGEPVLGDAGLPSRTISWASIAAADPDVVIVAPCGFDLARTLAAIAPLAARPEWAGLRALREGRAYAIDGNAYVNRPGPRLIETAELFAHAIHGEAVVPDVADGTPPGLVRLRRA